MPIDKRQNDFYEQFMEQHFHKINNPEQFGMEDSLPFPIEPLRVQLRLLFHRNESAILAVILELILLMPYPRQCQGLLIIFSPILCHQLRE